MFLHSFVRDAIQEAAGDATVATMEGVQLNCKNCAVDGNVYCAIIELSD